MSGPPSNKPKKKKREKDDQSSTLKRIKSTTTNTTTKPFENTLSIPIQQALFKFREASEQELIRLRKEGLEPTVAINRLVEKMRTIESDVSPCFSRQELDLVMEMAGINEEGAMRALILRSELAKLRNDGFNHPEAINELARRMKRLAGSKRRISWSMAGEGTSPADPSKHRRKDILSSLSNNTPTINNPLTRVSFTHLTTPTDTTPAPNNNTAIANNPPHRSLLASQTRKRLQDALMMDDEAWGLRKRPRYLDNDISDSSDGEGGEENIPLDSELYHFDDVGEFSQDEDKDEDDEEHDGDDLLGAVTSLDDIPLFTAFANDYPSSDEEQRNEEFDEEHAGIQFHNIKEEEESDDDTWTTITSATPTTGLLPTTPTSSSTTTTTTTTTTPTTTTTRTSRIPKQRDSLSPGSLSQRTVS